MLPNLKFKNTSGMFLDSKLDFKEHIQYALNKVSKTIGLLRKLQNILPRPPLITIYKSFTRSHLDYGDIIYDQAYNVSFHQELESIQYNAALAIVGAIRGTSRGKLYRELGFESLVSRRWYRKLCCFYKVFKTQSPRYLFDVNDDANDKLMISWLIFKKNIIISKILSFLGLEHS